MDAIIKLKMIPIQTLNKLEIEKKHYFCSVVKIYNFYLILKRFDNSINGAVQFRIRDH